jgi:DNA-binding winged helix-turn-helix (wHTH) protein
MRGLRKRVSGSRAAVGMIPLGAFALDVQSRVLRGAKVDIEISPLVARFLESLAAQPGSVVTRQQLIDRLWDGNHLVGEPALNRVASETRMAIREAGGEPLIETVQRRGYRLVVRRGTRRASDGLSVWTIAIAMIAFLLVAGVLHWLMDSAMGVIWLSSQAN